MPRVLLIDDHKTARIALQTALEPFGFDVEQADGGPAGLQKALSARWDLIFLDLEMPVMDGATVLRLVRARDARTPIVLVTSVSSTPVLTATMRLGATSYLPKSLPPAQLRAAVAKLLQVEPPRLDAPGPRVLVYTADDALARVLSARLPANVQVSSESNVESLLELCARRGPGLVLLDDATRSEGLHAAAASVRAMAPSAGVFVLREDAPAEGGWQDAGPIDGVVPRALGEVLGYELLYLNFLRSLVFIEENTARAASFQGDEAHLPAYFCALGRQLVARCARLERADALRIELHAVPDGAGLVPMIARVSHALAGHGTQPWFDLRAAHEPLKSDPSLAEVFFL